MTDRMVGDHRFVGMSSHCAKCGRSEVDILSYADIAKVDDEGISCTGRLTASELLSLQEARAAQQKIFELVNT